MSSTIPRLTCLDRNSVKLFLKAHLHGKMTAIDREKFPKILQCIDQDIMEELATINSVTVESLADGDQANVFLLNFMKFKSSNQVWHELGLLPVARSSVEFKMLCKLLHDIETYSKDAVTQCGIVINMRMSRSRSMSSRSVLHYI